MMLRKVLPIAAASIIVVAFGFGAAPLPAEAVTPIGYLSTITSAADPYVPAAQVKKKTVVKKKNGKVTKKTTWVYDPKKNGKRYKYKNGAYTYYYGGYYYARPWWTIGVPGVNLCIGC
jgi:hypothetical protein